MPKLGFGTWRALSLGAFLAVAAFVPAALPKTEEAPQSASLAGQLLVASPEIGDPRFHHAVILVVQQNKEGALGIVINRPLGEVSLASLLDAIGKSDPGVTGNVRIYAGGPVQPMIGFIVHSGEYRRSATVDIDGRVAMTASAEILRDIGHHNGPKKFLAAFGYTGWGPGQLEDELAQGAWFTEPENPKLVFDDDREKLWDKAMALRVVPL